MSQKEYKATFFIVPSHILSLPGLTLSYLKFYETIFQFWNNKQECFLSNDVLKKRTGIKSISSIIDAFQFFESHGQLSRIYRDKKRFIIQQPIKSIEAEELIPEEASNEDTPNNTTHNNNQGIAGAIGGYRCSDSKGIARAIYNNKKLIKESNVRTVTDLFLNYKDLRHLFTARAIPCPLRLDENSQQLLEKAIALLEKNDFTLDNYLEYLYHKCRRWLIAIRRVGNLNDFYTILKEQNILKAMKGDFGDFD